MRAAACGTNTGMERWAEALLLTSLTKGTGQLGMLSCLNITFLVGLQLPPCNGDRDSCALHVFRIGGCVNLEGHNRSQHMNFGSLNESIASLGGPMKKTLPGKSKAIKSPVSGNPYP